MEGTFIPYDGECHMAKAVLVAGHPGPTELVRRVLLVGEYEVINISTPTLVSDVLDGGDVGLVVIVLTETFAEEQVDATVHIVEQYPDIPVLAISPNGDVDMTKRMEQAGAREVIHSSVPRWMATLEAALADLKQ